MSKKVINQNTNYDSELLNSIGSNFIFDENPINRLKNTAKDLKKENDVNQIDKKKELNELKLQINSINDCNLKNNSKKIVLGDGNINSPIMLVGEAPGVEEDNLGLTFLGDVGDLLRKMLMAIKIKKKIFILLMLLILDHPKTESLPPLKLKDTLIFCKNRFQLLNQK